MNKIRKLFTKNNISWKSVILLSMLCGIIPGILMCFEELDRTSFQQPGITFEFWICMAMYIMLNFCVDVKSTDYFYEAVLWAYENDICNGTDALHDKGGIL